MENLPEVSQPRTPISTEASLFLDVARFEHAQRVAKMLATSTMIPEHFRNNVGNCVIALNLAERFMADPFMVMQNVYVVHGRPGLEGKLVIALINQCGKFTPLKFNMAKDNKGNIVSCTAIATHKETKEQLEQAVTWEMVTKEGWDKKSGSKWLTMPDLMFKYRSATFFARVYCPEVILGMMTTDELFDFIDMKKTANGTYKTTKPESKAGLSDPSDFNAKIKSKIVPDDGSLDKFLELTANAQAITVDKLKAIAAEDFESFWGAYETWRNKSYPTPEEPEQKWECPHCDFIAQSERGLKSHITRQHTNEESEQNKTEAAEEPEPEPTNNAKDWPSREELEGEAEEIAKKKVENMNKINTYPQQVKDQACKQAELREPVFLSTESPEKIQEVTDLCDVIQREIDESNKF